MLVKQSSDLQGINELKKVLIHLFNMKLLGKPLTKNCSTKYVNFVMCLYKRIETDS